MGKWVFCVVFRFKLDVFIHGYFNPEFPLDDFLKQSKKDRFIYKILSRKIHLDLDYISEIFRDHEKQKRKWCLTDSVSCSTSEDVRGTQRDFGDQDAKAKYQNWSFEYKNNALALRQPRPLVEDSCPSWSHHPPQIFKLTSAYDPLQTLPVPGLLNVDFADVRAIMKRCRLFYFGNLQVKDLEDRTCCFQIFLLFMGYILDEDQMQCPMERLSPTSDLVENVLVIVLRAVSKFLFLLYGGCYLLIARVALHDLYLESN
ncbi:LOW QUALITY PROTEIN: hypothetical protein NC652_022957 [Populus alba x Populus x berolinensis]|nr:LOW QUALITY PROTEIN: hypothetical protein NC652_022957 [Populus alba x Populus x berolinensis]